LSAKEDFEIYLSEMAIDCYPERGRTKGPFDGHTWNKALPCILRRGVSLKLGGYGAMCKI